MIGCGLLLGGMRGHLRKLARRFPCALRAKRSWRVVAPKHAGAQDKGRPSQRRHREDHAQYPHPVPPGQLPARLIPRGGGNPLRWPGLCTGTFLPCRFLVALRSLQALEIASGGPVLSHRKQGIGPALTRRRVGPIEAERPLKDDKRLGMQSLVKQGAAAIAQRTGIVATLYRALQKLRDEPLRRTAGVSGSIHTMQDIQLKNGD